MKRIAIEAAMQAGKILIDHIGNLKKGQISRKNKFDFVTHVDKLSEAKIIEVISGRYPEHRFYAEEGIKQDAGGHRWIIDPLDGTTNYIHTYPCYAISIALEIDGRIELGVIYDPGRDELFVAEKGGGATLNGSRIHVSGQRDPALSLLCTGFPFRCKENIDLYLDSFKQLFLVTSGIRRTGSVALDFCSIASGRSEGFWEIGLSPWDVAAGYLMILEAGGKMTDFAGGDDPIWTGNVVASNGYLHEHILNTVRAVFAGYIER